MANCTLGFFSPAAPGPATAHVAGAFFGQQHFRCKIIIMGLCSVLGGNAARGSGAISMSLGRANNAQLPLPLQHANSPALALPSPPPMS